jgi:hypothetical protein
MPETASVPDQLTIKLAAGSAAGNALTLLLGGVLSIVLDQTAVEIGALVSKITVA